MANGETQAGHRRSSGADSGLIANILGLSPSYRSESDQRHWTLPVLSVRDLELRVGARTLMEGVTFRVDKGDKIGLVGRNGAGKTTLAKTLAGETRRPTASSTDRGRSATCRRTRAPATRPASARTRILDARGLGQIVLGMQKSQQEMGSSDAAVSSSAMDRYAKLEDRFLALGGYAAEAEAASIASNLGLPDRILDQQVSTLSGGQRRRIELARILFAGADTMLLDEPTNHLDADSVVWLRDYLKSFNGGLVVISHDIALRRGDRQPRVLPGCQPHGHRHLQHGLEELPAPA